MSRKKSTTTTTSAKKKKKDAKVNEEEDEVVVCGVDEGQQQFTTMPAHVAKQRDEVGVTESGVENMLDYAHDAFANFHIDGSFNLEKFKKEFRVENFVARDGSEDKCTFELIGVDAPIANALRRIMISRVPTMAIDIVSIADNSSVMPDEVLAHRLGLIPLKAPATLFGFSGTSGSMTPEAVAAGPIDSNQVLQYELNVTCRVEGGKEVNNKVTSNDLKWVPVSDQGRVYTEDQVKPVHSDIVIAKLAPGQSIRATCYAYKGRGETHAKWSPVATAHYKLLPIVRIQKEIRNESARKLRETCPSKVFDIEDGHAIVKNAKACTMCRECLRHEEWTDKIELARAKRHFMFSIESTGAYPGKDIFVLAVKELMETVDKVVAELKGIQKEATNTGE